MADLLKLNLDVVPPIARAVNLSYKIKPAFGKIVIYRVPNDPDPFVITGIGQLTINLIEPQALYIQLLSDTKDYQINVSGFQY